MNTMIKRLGMSVAVVAALSGGATYGYRYWAVDRFMESTDDAFLKADFSTISPKVSGYIAAVLVDDNQTVKAGQVLARIDDRDFQVALTQAAADVATAEAELRNLSAQMEQQKAMVVQAEANLTATGAGLRFARADYTRYHSLREAGFVSVQRDDQAETAMREKAAVLQGNQAALLAAKKHIDVLETQRAKAATQLDRSRAVAHQAELNLSYTTITAPIDGSVGARSLRAGQFVQAGTALMAVVPLKSVYVVANFKETQLTHVVQGQLAEISVDSFPGVTIKGRIDSLAPASGLEFALLPPDNATGNFTKIVQRIPVKIALAPDSPLVGQLRPGMSVIATVNTKPAPASNAVAAASETGDAL